MIKSLKLFFLLHIFIIIDFYRIKCEECSPKIFPTFGTTSTFVTFENFNCFNSSAFSTFKLNNTYLSFTFAANTFNCPYYEYRPILKADGSFYNNTHNWKIPFLFIEIYNNYSVEICNYPDRNCILLNGVQFLLKPFPSINQNNQIISKKTILSGGQKQIFIGSNFDSIAYPYLDVFTRHRDNTLLVKSFLFDFSKIDLPRRNAVCSVESNGTKMICETPRMNYLQGIELEKFDFNSYMLPSSFDLARFENDFYRLSVFKDPVIADIGTKDYPENDRPHPFVIPGSNFLDACDESDYTVSVGDVDSTQMSVASNVISFFPPRIEPASSASDKDGAKAVKVRVGNLDRVVGYIQYNPKSPDWHWIVGVACGAAAIIVLAIIILCCIYKKYKTPPTNIDRNLIDPQDNDYIQDGIMRYIPMPNQLVIKKIDFSDLELGEKLSQGKKKKVPTATLR